MGRQGKNAQAQQGQGQSNSSTEGEAEDKALKVEGFPKEVTFAWNRASKEQVIVMQSAKVLFTDAGVVTDPREPAKRIKVKMGLYTTSDRDEIEFLTSTDDFNSKGVDGFSIVKDISPKEDLKSLMKRHKITKEELASIAQ